MPNAWCEKQDTKLYVHDIKNIWQKVHMAEDCKEIYQQLTRNGYILYNSNYITFWKRQIYGNSKKKKSVVVKDGGGRDRQSTEDF